MKGWLTFLELLLFFLIRLFISKSLFFIFFKWSFVRISHSYYCDDLIFFSYKRKALHTGHYDLILSSGCKIIPFAESFSVPGCPYPPFPVSWRSCSIPLTTEPSSKEKLWGTAGIVCLIPSVRKNWSNVRTVHVMGEKVTTLCETCQAQWQHLCLWWRWKSESTSGCTKALIWQKAADLIT